MPNRIFQDILNFGNKLKAREIDEFYVDDSDIDSRMSEYIHSIFCILFAIFLHSVSVKATKMRHS